MVELKTDLPPLKDDSSQHPRQKSGLKLLVPEGTKLLSRGAEVTSSDDFPILGEIGMITDGNDGDYDPHMGFVELMPGLQWVQIDLGKQHEIQAIVVWNSYLTDADDYYNQGEAAYLARVYQDVVIQISNDPLFEKGVATVFNNDQDNSSGLGKGDDDPYVSTSEGHWVATGGTVGRYVRVYSNGHVKLFGGEEMLLERGKPYTKTNDYAEIEIYGM